MKLHPVILFAYFLLLCSGCVPQRTRQDDNPPREVILAISPFLPGDGKSAMFPIVAWVTRQANCHIRIYDGWEGVQVAAFTVPKVEYYKEDAVMRRIGAPLLQWMAWSGEKPSNPKLSGSGAVCLPKLLALLAQERSSPENLVIVGSPVARFLNATNYDFAEPALRFPADGQIALDQASPFSCQGFEHSLSGTKIFYLYPRIDTMAWPARYDNKLHHFFGRFFVLLRQECVKGKTAGVTVRGRQRKGNNLCHERNSRRQISTSYATS